MTYRAVLLGLLGVALVCGLQYLHFSVLSHGMLVSNNLPLPVYGGFILLLLALNPLLYLLGKRLALRGPELAVILGLTLAACCIPSSTLMRHFTTSLIMPFYHERSTAAWKTKTADGAEERLIKRVPEYMLADVRPANEKEVLDPFVQGKSKGTQHITPLDVPWLAWGRTLLYWVPLILLFWACLLGLTLVVHRQWADHEQLPYPIASFANALLPRAKEAVGEVLRLPLFWLGAIPVLLIHMNRLAATWYADWWPLPNVSMKLDITKLNTFGLGPMFTSVGANQFFTPTLVFAFIAVAFLIPADVSLSLGLSAIIWALLAAIFLSYGMNLNAGEPSPANMLIFGAYVGVVVMLIFVGRRYYRAVFARAVGVGRESAPGEAVWGARLFMAAILALIAYLVVLGRLDPLVAVLFAGIVVMIFLVLGRIMAETGLFFLVPGFVPHVILLGLLGPVGLGPQAYMMAAMASTALFLDPRDTLVPFLLNAFKMSDLQRVHVGKTAAMAGLALVVGLGVALPVTLYFQYDRGAHAADEFAFKNFPSRPFNSVVTLEQKINAQGRMAEATLDPGPLGLGHLSRMSLDPKLLIPCLIGLGLLVLCTVARLRIPKWPLHPVFFLVWTVWSMKAVAPAFLLGWLAKVLVTKFGGAKVYHQVKPLAYGLIAGEALAAVIAFAIGAIYAVVTGQSPKGFGIIDF